MTSRPAPYPPDTRAKGWRFELDYERIEQSATWGLTTLKPEARPWLLMTWYTAWKQVPCGSMPADPELFAALIGASDTTFAKHRKILLRGWWMADDGLLYHDTLVQRVLEMLRQRQGGNEISSWAWQKLRQTVFERDGYACTYCGKSFGVFQYGRWRARSGLHCDHVIPKSRGGLSTLDNLVAACGSCNNSKGAKTLAEWSPA